MSFLQLVFSLVTLTRNSILENAKLTDITTLMNAILSLYHCTMNCGDTQTLPAVNENI